MMSILDNYVNHINHYNTTTNIEIIRGVPEICMQGKGTIEHDTKIDEQRDTSCLRYHIVIPPC